MDDIGEIVDIVRDAIKDGIIRSETVETFDARIQNLSGNDLEDYLQILWDAV